MIQIGFSTHSSNIVSRIIRYFTKSKASHTWILLDDDYFGMSMVMEASEWGFRLIPFEVFKQNNEIVALMVPAVPIDAGVKEAAHWLGEWYDFLGLFGTFFVLVGHWLKRKWANPFRSPKSMFCSEAVVRVLISAKYPGAELLDPSSTTPQELMDFLSCPVVKPLD